MSKKKDDNIFTRKIVSISILIILYIFTGLFATDQVINPFNFTDFLRNIEFIVASTSAIIFGPIIGATVGGLGYFILEIILRIIGVKHGPIGVEQLIPALALFIGNWVTGMLARTDQVESDSIFGLIFSGKTWYNLLLYMFSTILGLAVITNLIRSMQFYKQGIEMMLSYFLPEFYYSIQLIVVILPAILVLYNLIGVFREKRAKILDQMYRQLDTQIDQNGPAEIKSVSFKDHALVVGKWTAIDVEIKHTWKAPRSYDIETVSTSKVYPHKDTTAVLGENATWTHTFFIQPLEEDHVDVRIRIHPAHTIKYKEKPKQQTDLKIVGKTYIQRDILFLGVFIFSEVLITLFIFSLLWNQIASIIVSEFFNAEVKSGQFSLGNTPWNLLLVIAAVETLLFLPFLTVMYKLQKPSIPDSFEEELAFSQDIQTHHYHGIQQKRGVLQRLNIFYLPALSIFLVGISVYLTFRLYLVAQYFVVEHQIPSPTLILVSLSLMTLLAWTITLLVLKNATSILNQNKHISVDTGNYITKVESLAQFKIHKPTEILFTVKNVSKLPGLRILFESNDSISPPVIELHVDPGEIAQFKASVTPQSTGTQEILAVIYPLFDEDKTYIPLNESRPINSQHISYSVLGHTIIGITQNQARTLRHIFGWGSLLTSTMAIANEYIGIEQALRSWQQTMPYLATLQIPFIYIYYIFSNRYLTTIEAY